MIKISLLPIDLRCDMQIKPAITPATLLYGQYGTIVLTYICIRSTCKQDGRILIDLNSLFAFVQLGFLTITYAIGDFT